jgi:hypothetical protein
MTTEPFKVIFSHLMPFKKSLKLIGSSKGGFEYKFKDAKFRCFEVCAEIISSACI